MADKPHPLEFLIGTWKGRGKGFYPTIEPFEFFEELTFTKDPAGRPVVAYVQKTRRAIPDSEGAAGTLVPGPPLHAESGFIRLPGWSNEKCELILSQPTGVASIEVGSIKGTTIDWETTGIIRSPSAKAPQTTQFMRKWVVDPEQKTFSYEFSMATENTPLTRHLEIPTHSLAPRKMALKLNLELDSLPYTIHRLPPTTPASVYLPLIDHQAWYSITKTSEEISLVVSHAYPASGQSILPNDEHKISPSWRCFKVAGPLDFSLVGIMANLSGALAEHKISVFVVSTYDTDYILVKEDKAMDAKKVFESIGHSVVVL
ncbi:THAP domain-containing protein 4 [Linnemannia zychae]|nr:THAP domain-containing protein 4 [Linnemannia zychae]